MFYKVFKSKSPQSLFKLIPEKTSSDVTRNPDNIPLFNIRHNFYKNSFFPSSIIDWNNLHSNYRNSKNFVFFKNNILELVRPEPNSFLIAAILRGLD